MIGYAARAVPWRLVLAATALLGGCMALVGAWPYVMWPLQGAAVGLVAGAVAWALDERLAGIVDTAPRSLRWRTTARCAAVPVVLAAWVGSLLVVRDRLPDHLGLFVLQGVVAAVGAVVLCTWRRAAGVAEPGRPLAAFAIPAAAAVALARPLAAHLPVFPVWPSDPWATSTTLWAATLAATLAAGLTLNRRRA